MPWPDNYKIDRKSFLSKFENIHPKLERDLHVKKKIKIRGKFYKLLQLVNYGHFKTQLSGAVG
jgi:hypothetical protein